MAQPINSWGDFKKALTELRDPEVQEMFETVIIDTADIAYSYCEKYICSRESDQKNTYETVADIPYGKGYTMAQDEFDTCIRKILQLNYGLVLISHSTEKTFTNEKGQEVSKIVPTLDKRARLVCERTCDIIGYSRAIDTDDGNKTILFSPSLVNILGHYYIPSIENNTFIVPLRCVDDIYRLLLYSC